MGGSGFPKISLCGGSENPPRRVSRKRLARRSLKNDVPGKTKICFGTVTENDSPTEGGITFPGVSLCEGAENPREGLLENFLAKGRKNEPLGKTKNYF